MSNSAKLMSRFLSKGEFIEHMTLGVHNFIMKRLYRNLFEKMGPSERDKSVVAFYKGKSGLEYQKKAENALKTVLKMDKP